MKYRILLLFSVLTFGVFLPKANNSAIAQSNEDFATTVYKTREEVSDITYELKNTLSDYKKLLLEINALTDDIDKVLLKFKNSQIKDCNNEIRNIDKRIKTLLDKVLDSASKIDDFNKRKAAVDCQLDENPRLKNLVYMNDLYNGLKEWNVFNKEFGSKLDIYLNKRDAFMSKVRTLPSVRKIQKEADGITKEWETLLSDDKKLLSEMNILIKDIDKAIGKIDNREITNYNNEIKNINDRIGNLDNKNNDIIHRQDELYSKADSVGKSPEVGNLVVWTEYNKVIGEWNALLNEEINPKLDIYNKKLDALMSKVKNFTAVRKLQNKLNEIIKEDEILISDEKKLLSEMDLLMKDMDRVIEKINRREITNYNNEIKDIDYRINIVHNKNNDISRRNDEFNRKVNAVSKTPGVGCMVDWTDYNKVLAEWNALMTEEANQKFDIYNKKVETFNSITANLSNHQ